MAQREGYILIDHQASPGLPEDLAVALNLDPASVKEGKIFEGATLTCAHCTSVIIKNPLRMRERASCMKCSGKYLCDGCALLTRLPDYDHTPFEKKVDLAKNLVAQLGSPPLLLQAKG